MNRRKGIFARLSAITILLIIAVTLVYPRVIKSSEGADLEKPSVVIQKDSPSDGWVLYENKQLGFKVHYPEGWKIEESDLYMAEEYAFPSTFQVTFSKSGTVPTQHDNFGNNFVESQSWNFEVKFKWNSSSRSLEEIADELLLRNGGEYKEYKIDGVRAIKVDEIPVATGKIGPVYLLDYEAYTIYLTSTGTTPPGKAEDYQNDFEKLFVPSFSRVDFE